MGRVTVAQNGPSNQLSRKIAMPVELSEIVFRRKHALIILVELRVNRLNIGRLGIALATEPNEHIVDASARLSVAREINLGRRILDRSQMDVWVARSPEPNWKISEGGLVVLQHEDRSLGARVIRCVEKRVDFAREWLSVCS